jgi:hypothetical protein
MPTRLPPTPLGFSRKAPPPLIRGIRDRAGGYSHIIDDLVRVNTDYEVGLARWQKAAHIGIV